jgi:bifunctional DNA-binding transcriptional regulator/antitoxin component of YhaV-PrlF toxin-antitoxin module
MTTTLTGKNQITVPAEITAKLGLVAGAQFDWAVGDQPNKITITIKPTRKQMLERIRELGRKWKKPGQDPIGDLIRERVQDDIDEGMWEK